MLNQEVIVALKILAQTRTDEDYLGRQDALFQRLPCEFVELVDVAYDHENSSIRIEALELIAMAANDNSRTVLSDSAKADPDPLVQKHAEALLFRAIVNENLLKHFAIVKD